jgi:hypothetical protein
MMLTMPALLHKAMADAYEESFVAQSFEMMLTK